MSGPKFLNALASARQQARQRGAAIFVVAVLGAFGIWMAWRTPKTIEVHLLPNITADSTVTVVDGQSKVPPQNVYVFGYYIWQQINRWSSDGSIDYAAQIQAMQAYVTPQCSAQLTGDVQARNQAGELKYRTRTVSEIPGLGYSSERVLDEGSGQSWTVFLDTQVQETFRGMPVKQVFIRYPVRIVRYDVDRERNPWQLALDCFGGYQPARLDENALRVMDPVTRKPVIKAPTLPGAVEPAALPQVTPLDAPSTPVEAPASSAEPSQP